MSTSGTSNNFKASQQNNEDKFLGVFKIYFLPLNKYQRYDTKQKQQDLQDFGVGMMKNWAQGGAAPDFRNTQTCE